MTTTQSGKIDPEIIMTRQPTKSGMNAYPSALIGNPGRRVPLDHEPHGLHQSEQVLRVPAVDAVDGQASGDAEQGDDLAPRDVRL